MHLTRKVGLYCIWVFGCLHSPFHTKAYKETEPRVYWTDSNLIRQTLGKNYADFVAFKL